MGHQKRINQEKTLGKKKEKATSSTVPRMLPNYKPTISLETPYQRVALKVQDVVEMTDVFNYVKFELLLQVCTNLARVLFQVEI
jgi:hypothetical protein